MVSWTEPVLMHIKNSFTKYSLNSLLARTIFGGSALYPIAEPLKRFCNTPFFESTEVFVRINSRTLVYLNTSIQLPGLTLLITIALYKPYIALSQYNLLFNSDQNSPTSFLCRHPALWLSQCNQILEVQATKENKSEWVSF